MAPNEPHQQGQPPQPETSTQEPGSQFSGPVSWYSSNTGDYSLETLEVADPNQAKAESQHTKVKPQTGYHATLSQITSRKAAAASLVITLVILAISALSLSFLLRQSPDDQQSIAGPVPSQDIVIPGEPQIAQGLEGEAQSLLVNGDILTKGNLKVTSGDFYSVIQSQTLSDDQTISLPNASGVICLDANNCDYASTDDLAALQGQINAIEIPDINLADIPDAGVTTVNGQDGALTIQGTSNRISVSLAGNTITIATPQNIATGSSPTFANLRLSGLTNGFLQVNGTGQLSVGVIDLGTDTNGSYVASFTAGNGLTGDASGEGSTPTLNIVSANGGIVVNPNDITLTLQTNKGLEVDGNGLSLVDCADGEILKYETTGGTWQCDTDAGAGGSGDSVQVNGVNATDANFINTTADATTAGTSFSLNTASSPDEITLSISAASAVQAGMVTANAQAFGGDKTFSGQIIANGNISSSGALNITPGGALTVGSTTQTALLQGSTTSITSTGAGNDITLNSADALIFTAAGNITLTGFNCSANANGGTLTTDVSGNLACADDDYEADTDTNTTYSAGNDLDLVGTTFNIESQLDFVTDIIRDGGNLTIGTTTSGNLVLNSAGTIELQDNTNVTGNLNATGNADFAGTLTAGTANAFQVDASGNVSAAGLTGTSLNVGAGTITSGLINGQTISATANFTGTLNVATSLTTPTLNLGAASTTSGAINLFNSASAFGGTLNVDALGQATTFTLPDPGQATADICLSTGNCAGAGGGITGSGTAGTLPYFNTSSTLADSVLSQSGGNLTATGNATLQGGTLTLGVASTTAGQLNFYNSSNSFLASLVTAAVGQGTTYTLPDPGGATAEVCLNSGNCLGGGGGAAPADAQYLTLALSGSLTNERLLTPGTSLSITDGGANGNYNINTIQDIRTTASPTFASLDTGQGAYELFAMNQDVETTDAVQFAGLTLTGNLQMNANTIQGTTAVIDFTNFDVAGNGNTDIGGTLFVGTGNAFQVDASGNIVGVGATLSGDLQVNGGDIGIAADTDLIQLANGALTVNGSITGSSLNVGAGTITSGLINGQTISSSANFTGTVNVASTATVQGATLTVGTSLTNNGSLVLLNATNAFNVAISGANQTTGSATISFPDTLGVDDTFCLETLDNCSATPQNTFSTFDAPGGTDPVADSATDTIALANGTNITITGDSGTDTLTFAVVDNPTFSGLLTANGGIDLGTQTLQGTTAIINFNNFDVAANGNITTAGDVAINGGDLTTTGVLNITPGGALTVGSTTQTALLQGSTTSITSTGAGNDITLNSADALIFTAAGNITLTGFNCSANANGGTLTTDVSGNLACADDDYEADTDTNTTYSAGNDLDLVGTTFNIESQLDFVTDIIRDGGNLTIGTTTSGNLVLNSAGTIELQDNTNVTGNLNATGNADFAGTLTAGTANAFQVDASGNVSAAGLTGTSLNVGAGTITSGLINGQTISATANFTGTLNVATSLTTPTLNLGAASTTSGAINLFNSASAFGGTLNVDALGQATTFTLPDPGQATADICLSTGNCAGAGGGITGSGTAGTLPYFNTSSTLADSVLSQSGGNLTATGNATLQGGTLTLGVASTTAGQLNFYNSSNSFLASLVTAAVGQGTTYTLPDPGGATAEVCLNSGNCLGGGGGAAPADAQYLTLALSGSLTNERLLTPGTSLSITDGGANGNYNINTIQDIRTTASPTFASLDTGQGAYELFAMNQDVETTDAVQFAGLTLTGNLQMNANTIQGTTAVIDFTNFDVAGNGNTDIGGTLFVGTGNAFQVDASGNIVGVGATLSGDLQVNGGDIGIAADTDLIQLANGALTVNGSITGSSLNVGAGTITSGLINGQTISSSANFTGTVNVASTATVQGATLTVGTSLTNNGSLVLLNATNAFNVAISGANQTTGSATISFPDTLGVDDTFCLETLSNCAGAAPTLQSAYEGGNNITATNAEGDIEFDLTEATNFITDIQGTGNFIVQDGGAAVFTVADGGVSTFAGNLAVTALGSADTDTVLCRNSSNQLATCSSTFATGSGAAFVQGGNDFGASAILGTNGVGQSLSFETGGTTRFTVFATAPTLTGQGSTILNSTGTLAVNSAAGSALSVVSGTTGALNLDSGSTGAVNLGTGASAKTVTIGSVTGASSTAIRSGTGALSLSTASPGAGNAAPITLTTGSGAGGFSSGGTLSLTTGNGDLAGGNINLISGTRDDSAITGSRITVQAGNGLSGGGSLTLTGGNTNLDGLVAGNVNITGGNATVGTTENGGNVLINGGSTTGGSAGNVILANLQGNVGIGDATPIALLTVGAGDAFQVDASGNIIGVGATLSGDLAVNGGDITSTGALNVTPGGALTLGATTQSATLQGSSTTISSTGDLTLTPGGNLIFTGFNCTANANGGVLTADASGVITCDDDNSAPSGTVTETGVNVAGQVAYFTNDTNITSDAAFTFDGTDLTIANDLNVNGGDIASTGVLNITPGGALTLGATGQTVLLQGSTTTITSTGAGNDITLTSADQIILNSVGTIELQDNTNITGNLDASGTLTAGTADAFQVSAAGAVTAVGVNSGSGLIQGTGGLTVTGAANINATGAAATNVGTGTGTVAIGNATGTLALTSNGGLNVTTGGAVTGVSTLNTSGIITAGALGTASNDTVVCRNGSGQLATCNSTFATTTDLSGYATTSLNNIASTNLSAALNVTSGNLSLTTTTTGNIVLNSAGTIELQDNTNITGNLDVSGTLTAGTADAFQVNSSGDIITPAGEALNVATGTTGVLSLDTGTSGAINVGTSANAKTITIGNGTGATSLVLNAGTGAINIGTNAVARPISIGNTTGTSSLSLNSGSGALSINSTTGPISIGTTASSRLINIGIGAAVQTVALGSTNTTSATTIQGGSGGITLNSTSTIELQDNTNVTGDLDVSGTLTAGTADAFQVSAAGAVTAVGVNSGTGLIQGTGGLTVTGATNINTTGSSSTNIGNGTGVTTLTGLGIQFNSPLLQRVASGTTSFNLSDASNTTLSITNLGGGNANLAVSGTIAPATLGTASNDAVVCRNGSGQLATCNSTFATTTDLSGYATTALDNLASVDINAALNATSNNLNLTTTTTGNIVLNSAGTIELQDNTNVTGNLDVSGSVAVGNTASAIGTWINYVSHTFGSGQDCTIGCNGQLIAVSADNPTNPTGLGLSGLRINTSTAATAFTLTNAYGINVQAGSAGAGSTITNNYGIYVENQTKGTNDYGLYLAGADTNSLYVASGSSRFDGDLVTGQATQNLFNTTATAINAFGAASTINVGAAGANIVGGGALTVRSGGTNTALTLNSHGTGAVTLDSGTTGAVNIGTSANAKTVTIGNGTGATSLVLNAGTGAINIGTNAIARTTSIGNVTGASALNLNSGSGALNINSTTGQINIGSTASIRQVNLGTGAAAQTVTVGSLNSSSSTTIRGGTGGVTVGDTGVANTIQIGNTTGAVAQTINIGNNATASSTSTVTIGSTIGTSATTIQGGSGGITLNSTSTIELQDNTNVTGNLDVSGTLFAGTGNAFQVDASGNIIGVGATLSGDLQVNGGDIGIAADTDLLQLASGALTVNGTVVATLGAADNDTIVCRNSSGQFAACNSTFATTADITLQQAYTGGNTILATNAEGSIGFTLSEATNFTTNITGTGSFIVQDGGSAVLTIADGGVSTFDGNVVLAASNTLRLTGDTTLNRPAGADGELYFDTDTGTLLTYDAGKSKWMADRGEYTIVAANDSTQAEKDAADYVADGTDDQVQINNALTAAAGGKVLLLAGTYTTHQTDNGDATILIPNDTTLAGVGKGTLIRLGNIDVTDNLIENQTSGGSGIVIKDLTIDGWDAANTAGTQYGIYFNNIAGTLGSGAKIDSIWATEFRNYAIFLDSSDKVIISNSTIHNNSSSGIYIGNGSLNNVVSNNVLLSNGVYGIYVTGDYNSITANTAKTNTSSGFRVSGDYNTVTGNTAQSNDKGFHTDGGNGINISNNTARLNTTANYHIVYGTGHSINDNTSSQNTTGYNIYLDGTDDAIVSNNVITGGTSGISHTNSAFRIIVSNNRIYNTGGTTHNNAIVPDDGWHVTGNYITDSSASTANHAIYIANDVDDLYISDNYIDGASIFEDGSPGVTYGGQTNDVGDFVIQPSGEIDLNADTNITGSLTVGTTGSQGDLVMHDGNGQTATIRVENTLAADTVLTIPGTLGATDTFCFVALANCSGGTYDGTDFIVNGTTTQTGNFNIQSSAAASIAADISGHASQTANIFRVSQLPGGLGESFSVNSSGNGTFTAGLTVNESLTVHEELFVTGLLSASVFTGDVRIGTSDTTGTLLVLDTKTGAGDPTGVNGGTYYNSNTGKFRCYEGSTWKDCIGAGGTVTETGTNVSGQVAYFTSDTDITSSGNFTYNGTTLAVTNSSTVAGNKALQVTQSGATTGTDYGIYTTNTGAGTTNVGLYASASGATNNYAAVFENGRVGIGTASPTSLLHILSSGGASNGIKFANSLEAIDFFFTDNLAGSDFNISYGGTGGSDITLQETGNVIIGGLTGGNVGIGDTNPSATLTVTGAGQTIVDTDAVDVLTVTGGQGGVASVGTAGRGADATITAGQGGNGTVGQAAGDGGDITFQAGAPGTNNGGGAGSYGDVIINSGGGNVGIGDSTPDYKAEIQGSSGNGYFGITNSVDGDILHVSTGGDLRLGQTLTGATGRLEIVSNNGDDDDVVFSRHSNDGNEVDLGLYKSRGTSAAPTAVVNSDALGQIEFRGHDGTSYVEGANITGQVQGTVATGIVQTDLIFNTMNSAGSLGERLRITGGGNVGVGDVSPDYKFEVQGTSGNGYFGISSSDLNTADIFSIDGSGNIRINTTATADVASAKIYAVGNAQFEGVFRIGDDVNYVETNGSNQLRYTGTSRNDKAVTLRPEFDGATFYPDGSNNTGYLTSGFCSNVGGGLSVNTGICASTQSHSYYNWASAEATAQDYDMYVRYKLPSDFNGFSASDTIKLFGRRDASTDIVAYSLYQANGTQCGSTTTVTTSDDTWQEVALTGDETGCTFAAGDTITFRITVTSEDATSGAYVGELSFTYKSIF